ncbi:MAG: hypothetical protein MO847_08920 [Candidatus Protistobacter heckmanni]|nr:hypothetical protein [Candidatus Protistobacter heckmanni]
MGANSPARYAVSIQGFITGLTILVGLVIGVVAYSAFSSQIDNAVFQLEAQRLQTLNRRAAARVDRFLKFREAELGHYAQAFLDFTLDDPKNQQRWLDRIRLADSTWNWVGFILPDGKVQAGLKGRMEGRSVADQPWFRYALHRERVVLDMAEGSPGGVELMPPSSGSRNWNLVDLALRVRDKQQGKQAPRRARRPGLAGAPGKGTGEHRHRAVQIRRRADLDDRPRRRPAHQSAARPAAELASAS